MNISLDPDQFRPIIEATVAETVDHLLSRRLLSDRLAYPEDEAAALLGVARNVLRDARLRGEIESTRVGRRVCYTRDQLVAYLVQNRTRA